MTTEMLVEPQPWLSKAQAAARLEVSERTIETWIAERRLGSKRQPIPGKRSITVVDPHDVDRIAGEQRRGAILPAQAQQTTLLDSLPRLAALIAGVNCRPRPFLTIAEASDYSGLPPGMLRKLIRSGRLPAAHYSNEWYIKIADLETFDLRLSGNSKDR